MALSKCVQNVLGELEDEVLNGLKTLISTAKNGLSTIKTSKQALAANIDVSLAPLKLKKAALEAAVSVIRGGIKVIPPELTVQCPDLGAINLVIEKAIAGPLESLTNMLTDINRLTSQKSAANAEIAQLDTATQYLNDLEDAIDEVLNS